MSFMFGSSPATSSAPAAPRRRPVRRTTVKDGRIVTQFFNSVAGRPYPPIGRLNDTITVQMTGTATPFITTSTTVPTYYSTSFNLASFNSYSAFVPLFDKYRIEQIEVWLEPLAPGDATTQFGTLATCIDLDDANTPTTIAMVADHPGALVAQGSAARYHKWVPHIAAAVYNGAFTGYANIPPTWLDCADTSVQHYGFKCASGTTSAVVKYALSFRARVSFMSPGI